MSSLVVELENVDLTLTSRAGAVPILRNVSLAVPAGQTISVVGPSGSGKTSLLMLIAGLENATRGRVAVSGHDLSKLKPDDLAVLRGSDIGIVFQSFHLVPTMTALENVALPLELAGIDGAFDTARELLHDVGLDARIEHFPAELSGGEQQRVALARALSRRPKLILADEPTGNLDAKTGKHIVELLFGMKEKSGATLMLVTHDERLAEMTERTVRMFDGGIAGDIVKKVAARAVV